MANKGVDFFASFITNMVKKDIQDGMYLKFKDGDFNIDLRQEFVTVLGDLGDINEFTGMLGVTMPKLNDEEYSKIINKFKELAGNSNSLLIDKWCHELSNEYPITVSGISFGNVCYKVVFLETMNVLLDKYSKDIEGLDKNNMLVYTIYKSLCSITPIFMSNDIRSILGNNYLAINKCCILSVIYYVKIKGLFGYLGLHQQNVKMTSHVGNKSYREFLIDNMNNDLEREICDIYLRYKYGEITIDEYIDKISNAGIDPTMILPFKPPCYGVNPFDIGKLFSLNVGVIKDNVERVNDLVKFTHHIVNVELSSVFNFHIYTLFVYRYNDLIKKYNDLDKKFKVKLEELDKANDTVKKYKEAMRDKDKLIKGLMEEHKGLLSRIDKDNIIIEKFKAGQLIDGDTHNKIVDTYKGEINRYKQKVVDLERFINKKENIIKELHCKVEELETKLQLSATASNLKQVVVSNTSNICFNSVVNAIKNYKVVVVGGDNIHKNLIRLGLTGYKYYSASGRFNNDNEISYADLIVVITNMVAHSIVYSVKAISERCGTRVLMFNGKSYKNLCYKIFEEIYK